MRVLAQVASIVVLCGCPPPAGALRPDAWTGAQWMGTRPQPPDCAGVVTVGPESAREDRVVPGPGTGLTSPLALNAGDVRLVWHSEVSGKGMDWVAPLPEPIRVLWAMRVVPGGRCVVGTWGSRELVVPVVRHVFARNGTLEIVLLGVGPAEARGWQVLVTDGSQLWSGLDTGGGRPGAILGQQAEFRQEGDQLRLVVFSGGVPVVLNFDGHRFVTQR
jgi:hypothetical protein